MKSIWELIELIGRYVEPEPYVPECFCIPSGERANDSLWQYQESLGMVRGRIFFDRRLRYAVFFYSDYAEIVELYEYLISYHARKLQMIDIHRQRLVHPFGDADHFALVYRHHIFSDWMGIKRREARHRWRIPDRLIWSGIPILQDNPDYSSFMHDLQSRVDEGEKTTFDPDFQADVDELGSTRIVVESNAEMFLESDYNGSSTDWLMKWTLLKIRWG